MEGKTNFSRRLKQFNGLTCLTLTLIFYDGSTPAAFVVKSLSKRISMPSDYCRW